MQRANFPQVPPLDGELQSVEMVVVMQHSENSSGTVSCIVFK
jgi:hypothetical protein